MTDTNSETATPFHQIVNQHSHSLFRLAVMLTGDTADAEDILQETFLAAFRGWDRFEGRSSAKTWLTRILVRKVARHHRYHRIRRMLSFDALSAPMKAKVEGGYQERPITGKETEMDLERMLARLSREHREILVLREQQGLSYREISQILGVPAGTVESRLFRARREIRKKFPEYWKRVG